jgi:hypothetical protein
MTAVASLVATLDRRIVDLFDTLEELRTATNGISQLSDDGSEIIADLRSRMDRIEAKVLIDTDEVKNAVLSKLGNIDFESFAIRMYGLEKAVYNIEAAVTRLDRLVGGMVESVPDFITRRVKSRAVEANDGDLTG